MKRIVLALVAALVALTACSSATAGQGAPSPASGGSSSSGSSSGSESGSASGRPNIVFVLTDDLSLNLISHMPHVQAMQKAGMTFANYFVTDSLCCPSRTATFTGQYAHDNGVFTNSGDDGGYAAYNAHGDEKKSFAPALQKAGYRTAMMGKYLNGYQPNDPVPPGWNEWDVTGAGYGEYNYSLNENGQQHQYGHEPKDYLVDVMSQKAGNFIDSAAHEQQPFMMELATFAPHGPYTPAPRHQGEARDLSYPHTPAYDRLPADPPAWLKDRPALKPPQERKITTAYRKRVEAVLGVDDMIAHVQDRLKANGLADNTYLVFSSDNGYHMGDYRLMPGKQTAFDTDIHVPLVVSGPGVPAGRTTTQLAANIDLCPTFETLGGAAVPDTADGVSLDQVLHGQPPDRWQQAVLVEHHGPNNRPDDPDRQGARKANPPSYSAVRTADALYVRYANGGQEYYDLHKDPYELHNLAGDGVPDRLPATLAALQKCHGSSACQTAAGG